MNFKVRQDPCCCFPCLLGSPYQPLVTARLNLLISCVAMIGSQCFLLLGLARPVRAFPVGFQRELIRIPQPVPATWCKSSFLFGQLRGKLWLSASFHCILTAGVPPSGLRCKEVKDWAEVRRNEKNCNYRAGILFPYHLAYVCGHVRFHIVANLVINSLEISSATSN